MYNIRIWENSVTIKNRYNKNLQIYMYLEETKRRKMCSFSFRS